MEVAEKVRRRRPLGRRIAAVAATVLSLVCGWVVLSGVSSMPDVVVESGPDIRSPGSDFDEQTVATQYQPSPSESNSELSPLVLDSLQSPAGVPKDLTGEAVAEAKDVTPPNDLSDADIVAEIDRLVADTWQQHDPGPVAHGVRTRNGFAGLVLNIVGRIPTIEESTSFLASNSPRKRQQVIGDLVQSSERSSHLAVVWANMLIGPYGTSGCQSGQAV